MFKITQSSKNFLKGWGHVLIVFLISFYFCYHIFQGNRSLRTLGTLKKDMEHAHNTLDLLNKEQDRLERRVSLFRPEHICLDLLEEKSRELLGYALPEELVIAYNE